MTRPCRSTRRWRSSLGRLDLPTGTVTFLFTDIEGSTRLLHELGAEAYAEALAEHRQALRKAFARHGGVEVDTQGDAFFYAFRQASDALEAASHAQDALAGGPVRVRIGVHTGAPTVTREGYVGVDVHRAARVAAAGHGGQVVVSESTRLAAGRPLRPLGAHRLKDLAAPEPLWQLGEGAFPPLASLHQTNLPLQPLPLVGRERELGDLAEHVRARRLVTLAGPGGAGKTRLALAVAAAAVEDFPHGVWWVPLQAVQHSDAVEAAIAQAVAAKGDLVDHLDGKRLLLLVDNFEHVTPAAPLVANLLAGTRSVHILVTSREALRVAGENVYTVEPLPDDAAVALFVERSGQSEPRAAIEQICRRVDGLPLAIELAAARAALLPPTELLDRLRRRLPLLTTGRRDAPERQRTLRATIEWSHDLLDDEEQRVFRRLGVFAGSFDVAAAEAVCEAGLDELQSLLGKSLLKRWASGRLGMLETIHEFAVDQLEAAGEADDLRRRHADHWLALAEQAAPELHGQNQTVWLDRLAADDANLAAALDWTHARGLAGQHLRLAAGLVYYWLIRVRLADAQRRFARALALECDGADASRAVVQLAAGRAALTQGALDTAADHLERAIRLFRRLGDVGGAARAQSVLGAVFAGRGDLRRARSLYEESLAAAQEVGYTWLVAASLSRLGDLALVEGNYELAVEVSQSALRTLEEVGDDDSRATVLLNIGLARLAQDRYADARAFLAAGLRLADAVGDREVAAIGLIGVAAALTQDGAPLLAARLLATADSVLDEMQVVLPPVEDGVRAALVCRLQRMLSQDAYEAARAEGLATDLRDAVEKALVGTPSARGGTADA